ncbi:GSCOCG00008058001-RA-CDS [Cotesia congregata]|nr:GSCOCG00008058001-RA-CDS [Cotesia congregata]
MMKNIVIIVMIITKGNHVLTNPKKPTYFPLINMKNASFTMFQLLELS